jgi:hypothetical protein
MGPGGNKTSNAAAPPSRGWVQPPAPIAAVAGYIQHRNPRRHLAEKRHVWPGGRRWPAAVHGVRDSASAAVLPNAANSQSTGHEDSVIVHVPVVGVVRVTDRHRRHAGVVRHPGRCIAGPARNLSGARARHQPVRWRPTGGALGGAGEPTTYTWWWWRSLIPGCGGGH